MIKFNNAEKRERDALNYFEKIKEDIIIEEVTQIGSYEPYDGILWSGRTYMLVEVKIRDFEWDKYPNAYIEFDKINRLIQYNLDANIKEGRQPYFFSIYPKSRKALVFNIMDTPIKIENIWTWKTTMDKSKGKCWKAMATFPINNAIEINY
jgi:hypothetical protein